MSIKVKCSCIIPFYNEAKNICSVLAVVQEIRGIDEIICVDDGSLDNGSELVEDKFPRVKLIKLIKNKGKARAIQEGLKYSQNELILLLDADLRDLRAGEVEDALKCMQEKEVDMIVFRRVNVPWFKKLTRGDVLTSGQRILFKKDLKKIFKAKVLGYEIEMVTNRYMFNKKKKVFWMPLSAVNDAKMFKMNFWQGLDRDIKMHYDLFIKKFRFVRFLLHWLFFCRKRFC